MEDNIGKSNNNRYKSLPIDNNINYAKDEYFTLTKTISTGNSFVIKNKIEKIEKNKEVMSSKKNLSKLGFKIVEKKKKRSLSLPNCQSKLLIKNETQRQKLRIKTEKLSHEENIVEPILKPLTLGVASFEEANPKFREYMEDYLLILENFQTFKKEIRGSLYILCDGHSGEAVAKIVVNRFPEILNDKLLEGGSYHSKKENFIEDCITQSFRIMDEELVHFEEVGSTCNIIFIRYENKNGDRVVYSGNIGDSRSILVNKKEAIRLSYDHKAIDKSEIDRVRKEGGIILKKRFYGSLAITRAFGDYTYKIDGAGLSHIPYINRIVVCDDDQFIIMGSDGIWDVINEEKAYELIHVNKLIQSDQIAKFFVEKAVALGSSDNISCIVIRLN